MMVQDVPSPYPVQFEVEYSERQSRWKTFLRIPLAIPALIFAALALYAALFALPIMWLAILVRGRIPRWLFDFEVGVNRFSARVQAYLSLLTDVYPAFDGPYPVTYEVAYPGRVRRRQLVIWKLLASLPQWVVVSVLQYAALAVVAVSWLIILFTGRFPKGLHGFVTAVMRWRERVYAYSISLTDEYPPYSLSAEASATRGRAFVVSSAAGVALAVALVGGLVAIGVTTQFGGEERVVEVSYDRLLADEVAPAETRVTVNGIETQLVFAVDPAGDAVAFLQPQPGYRLVLFTFWLTNTKDDRLGSLISARDFELADDAEDGREPVLVVIGRRSPPVQLTAGQTATADVVFEVPEGILPTEVSFDRGLFRDSAVYRFR